MGAARLLLIPSPNIFNQRIIPYIPYGLLSLQAVAKDYDSAVEVLRPSARALGCRYYTSEQLTNELLAGTDLSQFDIIGLSTVCNSFHHTLSICHHIKAVHPSARIILGGPYVTKLASRILEKFDIIEAIFVGEAELSFADFLERCEHGNTEFVGIHGVATRTWDGGQGKPVDNLDNLPSVRMFQDFKGWFDIASEAKVPTKSVPLEASRGCPLRCTFCSTKHTWGAKVRRKSPARVYDEMNYLKQLLGVEKFNLIGDNFGVPRAHFLEFCDKFSRVNMDALKWGCSLKMDRLDPIYYPAMWNAGMRSLFVGVESGNAETLQRVRKKTIIEKELDNIRHAISFGFKVDLSFIIGFPWESSDDARSTFDLHCEFLKMGANRSQIGLLCPIPGTEIVDDHPIHFDFWSSYIAMDDIPVSRKLLNLTEKMPDLFSHLGHYETPYLPRSEAKAVRDAAMLLMGIREQNSENWNVF